ncbi:ergothioneine biosynthesis protein EgtB [Xylophilus rhododendri]|uniref:Ergothioneine biosynthesis protein EgtB n=1 Tax=Xylophilus rhododendri TaxID=2697032 RepID=A0A857J0E0_9BURK|nr:ergothioneine biosynthesis protein EgtB [Xylophilus rhododendri]QHI97334.1 ergothioneine biosynthesis protein EgtB [Xylophilus rhododendri]
MQEPSRPTASPERPERGASAARAFWQQRFAEVRAHTLRLASSLSAEDQCVQSMPDASPVKWHLAHTTWFFETVLLPRSPLAYQPFDASFAYLFNSYYEALGPRHPRPMRGLITRPSLAEVMAYRAHVDAALDEAIALADETTWETLRPILLLGLNHEQQHQELIATDVLHLLSCNPLLPAWQAPAPTQLRLAEDRHTGWIEMPGGIVDMGRDLPQDARGEHDDDFAFDNETPRHQVLLRPYAIADRLVSCADYLRFIEDGGYRTASLWLSDGWAAVQSNGWRHPAYWLASDDARLALQPQHGAAHTGPGWQVFGPHGLRPLDPGAAVAQLSFYEAAAYAEWAGARLPTEAEWEAAYDAPGIRGMTGEVWQWTRSSYDPYPGFRPLPGVAAEYNGKFMVGQVVLRGSSQATPPGHARPSYRNFFPPAARWQFSGLRLAKDL